MDHFPHDHLQSNGPITKDKKMSVCNICCFHLIHVIFFFTTVHPTYYCNNCINRTYTLQYFLNIVLLTPHSLKFHLLPPLILTPALFIYLSYLHFLPQLLLVPILFISHIYFFCTYIFIYSLTPLYICTYSALFCYFALLVGC